VRCGFGSDAAGGKNRSLLTVSIFKEICACVIVLLSYYITLLFLPLSELNNHFCIKCDRHLDSCTGVPRANEMFPRGSTPAKRMKITDVNTLCLHMNEFHEMFPHAIDLLCGCKRAFMSPK